jgi:hypothetical protein
MIDHPRHSIRLDDTRGEASRTAKLTNELVLAMRRERPRQLRAWLAERGVVVALETARNAMNGRTWAHLPLSGDGR